jgi:4-amino-4-deoxy-L-arabinose transferase-like glycosyltransferase
MTFNISPEVRKGSLILLTVFVLSLAVRIWLLDKRWINPDEGAHLMDAVLVLDGKIPKIDFSSRQPLYTYANAAVFKLFGISYISGRLLPMTCSVLIGILVFFMALMLFDKRVAILSAAIYWMLPLELINSVIVKTEPMVTLLTCLSLCSVILYAKSNRRAWLIFAGLFAAMGFYVRESALIIPLTVVGFLLIHHRGRYRDTPLCFGFFLIGYMGVFFLVMMYYTRFMRVEEFLMSGLSPFGFLASAGKKLFYIIGMSPDSANNLGSNTPDVLYKKYNLYYKYVRDALKLHSFLIIGLGFSIITLCRQVLSGNKQRIKEHLISYSLPYLWVFSLFIAYTYYYFNRGFYIDYFREFLPPLVIVFSAWIRYHVDGLERDGYIERFVFVGFALCGIVFAIFSVINMSYRTILLATGGIAIATFFIFSLKRTTSERFRLPNLINIAATSSIIGSLFLGFAYSGKTSGLSSHCVWSPESLAKTASYLKKHTHKEDRIMSGGVIWELQSQRKPFLNFSHPLGFEFKMALQQKENIEKALDSHPPEIIILDGYTERTYLRHIPSLDDFIASHYKLALTAGPARYKVRTYRLERSVKKSFLSGNGFS